MYSMNFKNYFNDRIIVEDVPVAGDYEEWYPSLRAGVSTRSQTNDVYLFKDIANALNITIPSAVDYVSQRLFDKLFPNNQPNPANTEEEYRDAIFNALTELVTDINAEAGTDIKNAKSQKTYTSRIISTLGKAVKTFNGIAPRVARAAINRVNQQVVQNEPPELPEPPLTEIGKLKNKLHIDGSGEGVDITPRQAKTIYGVRDIDNITPTDKIQLLKNIKEKLLKRPLNVSLDKFIYTAQGILNRLQPPVAIPFTGERRDIDTRLKRQIMIPYDVAAHNKIISSVGRNTIKDLVDRYNVIPGGVYINLNIFERHNAPCFDIFVALKTATDANIVYYERSVIRKPTGVYDRMLKSAHSVCTVREYNNNIPYAAGRMARYLNLVNI